MYMRKSYHADPSPKKEYLRKVYYNNPSLKKQQNRLAYEKKSEIRCSTARATYKINPLPKRRQVRAAYHRHPYPVIKRILSKYHLNPFAVKHRSYMAYHCNVRHTREMRRSSYAENPFPARNRAKKRYMRKQDEVLRQRAERRSTLLSAFSVRNKYNRMFKRKWNHRGSLHEYVNKLARKMGSRYSAAHVVKAELMVRSCMQQLSLKKHLYAKAFERLHNAVEASINVATDEGVMESELTTILCGTSLHTSTTELYFTEATYYPTALHDGNVQKEHFPGYTVKANVAGKDIATWQCCFDPLWCKLDPDDVIAVRLLNVYKAILNCSPECSRDYIQHIDDCSNVQLRNNLLQGHPIECYSSSPCSSTLLFSCSFSRYQTFGANDLCSEKM